MGQDVEWGYAFDVHLNAFFPLLMILHLFQLVFLGRKYLYCRIIHTAANFVKISQRLIYFL